MEFDDWKYYDTGKYIVVVNTFKSDENGDIHTNVYKARLKDIQNQVSVHDVMVQLEEIK